MDVDHGAISGWMGLDGMVISGWGVAQSTLHC